MLLLFDGHHFCGPGDHVAPVTVVETAAAAGSGCNFIMASLIVLSSLGISIGPLIAGAGVIGLAIGFGARTLVKDIISGIFFLVDDAFRVGDFIETAGTKDMVEHISLRSLRLRHPRGTVRGQAGSFSYDAGIIQRL